RDASECWQLRATTPLRVHLVGGGERFALMYTEEGARTFTLRVFDCRERLFDELAAGDSLLARSWESSTMVIVPSSCPRPLGARTGSMRQSAALARANPPRRAVSCKKLRRS